jgi:hypothetical protein
MNNDSNNNDNLNKMQIEDLLEKINECNQTLTQNDFNKISDEERQMLLKTIAAALRSMETAFNDLHHALEGAISIH